MEVKCYKLLSLDIWDTILRRKCHPDAIKVYTSREFYLYAKDYIKQDKRNLRELTRLRVDAEREIGTECKESGFDDEYNIKDVFRRWIRYACDKEYPNIDKLVEHLYESELNRELENIYLDPTIDSTIDSIRHEKLVCISDFYTDKFFLQKLIDSVGMRNKIEEIFCSCDYKLNKRSGRLFEIAEKECNVCSNEHIHIGDNAYSDVEVPKRLGIDAIHYLPDDEHKKRKERESEFVSDLKDSLRYKDFPLKSDRDISLFFYGFIADIMESCIEKKLKKIYFFTREGEFYKEIFDTISVFYDKEVVPKSYILEVSRLSTFVASLREFTLDEMMRLWNQYSIQSMSAMFKSLAMDLGNVKKFLDLYSIDPDEVLTYPWTLEPVQRLFADEEFKNLMEAHIADKRDRLLEYCAGKDLVVESDEDIAIVDIGWRGTIQDNLCYLFRNTMIYGYYVGLIQFLNKQPENSCKYGYLDKCSFARALLTISTPFEMICNSPNGSTVGYEKNDAGIMVAIRNNEKSEDDIFFSYTKKLQEKILSDCNKLGKYCYENFIVSEDVRNYAYEALRNFIYYPDRDTVNSYFNLTHNEEFGVGAYVDKRTVFRPVLMFLALISKNKRQEFKDFLRNTTWPQGYLTKYRLYPLIKVYNNILEKYY
jgi:hydrolase (HAD superfamily)-like protein